MKVTREDYREEIDEITKQFEEFKRKSHFYMFSIPPLFQVVDSLLLSVYDPKISKKSMMDQLQQLITDIEDFRDCLYHYIDSVLEQFDTLLWNAVFKLINLFPKCRSVRTSNLK